MPVALFPQLLKKVGGGHQAKKLSIFFPFVLGGTQPLHRKGLDRSSAALTSCSEFPSVPLLHK